MEHREVKSQTKADWVASWQVNLGGIFVGLEGVCLNLLKFVTFGGLGNVSVVVADHLDKETLGFVLELLVENSGFNVLDDAFAVLLESFFNGGLVSQESFSILGILGVLLNCRNCAPCGSLGGDQVLEGDGKKVTFISSE